MVKNASGRGEFLKGKSSVSENNFPEKQNKFDPTTYGFVIDSTPSIHKGYGYIDDDFFATRNYNVTTSDKKSEALSGSKKPVTSDYTETRVKDDQYSDIPQLIDILPSKTSPSKLAGLGYNHSKDLKKLRFIDQRSYEDASAKPLRPVYRVENTRKYLDNTSSSKLSSLSSIENSSIREVEDSSSGLYNLRNINKNTGIGKQAEIKSFIGEKRRDEDSASQPSDKLKIPKVIIEDIKEPLVDSRIRWKAKEAKRQRIL